MPGCLILSLVYYKVSGSSRSVTWGKRRRRGEEAERDMERETKRTRGRSSSRALFSQAEGSIVPVLSPFSTGVLTEKLRDFTVPGRITRLCSSKRKFASVDIRKGSINIYRNNETSLLLIKKNTVERKKAARKEKIVSRPNLGTEIYIKIEWGR